MIKKLIDTVKGMSTEEFVIFKSERELETWLRLHKGYRSAHEREQIKKIEAEQYARIKAYCLGKIEEAREYFSERVGIFGRIRYKDKDSSE